MLSKMSKLFSLNNYDLRYVNNQRVLGLDMIRVFAIFSVIAVHFFSLNTWYDTSPMDSISMVIQGMLKSIFGVAVPLFMMLTGFLNINKAPTKKYYKGMARVLVAYLLFCLMTILFRIIYMGEVLGIVHWLLKVFDFSAIPYAWYIEMWIGLALLAPFLNYLWYAIPNISEKLVLIALLFVMTALPDFMNRHVNIFPDYFAQACYPLMFYFIGAFIREYQPLINTLAGCILIILISLINPLSTLLLHGCNSIPVQVAGGAGGIFRSWIAVAIFLMFYRRDISVKPIKRWITHCSMVSLEMYLCCWMFDQLYYPWFKERFYDSQTQFLPWFLVLVPLVFLSSYLVAAIYNYLAAKVQR